MGCCRSIFSLLVSGFRGVALNSSLMSACSSFFKIGEFSAFVSFLLLFCSLFDFEFPLRSSFPLASSHLFLNPLISCVDPGGTGASFMD